MTTPLTTQDERFLARAIEISRRALEDEGKTPFGAIVVIGGEIVELSAPGHPTAYY
ncbi:hypothetical protein [Micromonospora sp. NPDC093244]|uniref:hypothetical protein n=1 Tax=Micromonospora sp. NPDC093244 TaxID=3155071 RepID=UPI00342EA294